ncbi:MAG: putative DNA binding domain-containing protein, partial [Planctomycetales bacterium]|nr:putative DNA binding domain-containing protein [Planctomycetales bacterium]
MTTLSFDELWNKLTEGDESTMLEVKRGSDVGKSILETVSAFSNRTDGNGGYLLLGVDRKKDSLFPDYEVVGVDNPDNLASSLATICRENLSIPVRPKIATESASGKTVLVVYIPEADPHQKPVFIKSRGSAKGSFRRIGPTDQVCTDDDLAFFYQSRGSTTFDESEIKGTSIHDVDEISLSAYRKARQSQDVASELLALSDSELLYALKAVVDRNPNSPLTLAGLLLFGKQASIRRNLPMTRIDYIRVDGTEWVGNPETRYQTVEKIGPLLLIIPQIINLVLDDIPKAFHLPETEVHRKDKPLIPKQVIREAIVNAVMHRSYRVNQPVQIIRYANRIEILNPGYSLVPDERLGESGSRTRNPNVAATLHDIGLAETKGTGIKVMRKAMTKANLTLPLIDSDRVKDEFKIRLLVHHLLAQSDVDWLAKFAKCKLSDDEARSLIILREIGMLDNATYRQINHMDVLTASGHLRRLRDLGILKQHGKGASTFYKPGDVFFHPEKQKRRKKRESPSEPVTQEERDKLKALRDRLPKNLCDELDAINKRTEAE